MSKILLGNSYDISSKLFFTVCLATAYFLSGFFGLLLATSPSNASPVWPASGIALATLLIYGRRAAPGILLGVLLTQYYSYSNISNTDNLISTAITSAIIGLGSYLQAIVGFFLVNRYIGHKDPLLDDDKIIRFFILAGPVSCLIASSIGIGTLYLQDIISSATLTHSWIIWWIGDVIGVMIFTPLTLIFLAPLGSTWYMRRYSVALPLMVLASLVMVLFQYGQSQESIRLSLSFDKQVTFVHDKLNNAFQKDIEIAHILQDFVTSSGAIDADKFTLFTRSIILRHQEIQALEWIARVKFTQRPKYEQSFHPITEPGSNGGMVPARQKTEYYPVTYIQPHADNDRAIGFDVSTNHIAWQAAVQARDQGVITATRKIQLIQDRSQYAGLVIYAPVFQQPQIHGAFKDKRQNFLGFAAVVIRIDDVVANVLNQLQNNLLQLKITDHGELLFNGFSANDNSLPNYLYIRKNQQIKFMNQLWEVSYLTSVDFFRSQNNWITWWLPLIGFLFTGMTGMGLLMLTGRTLKIEQIVKTKTQNLQQEITERNRINLEYECHNRVLQAVASNMPLPETLELICISAQQMIPGSLCSILLLDTKKQRLFHGAAPDLPAFYNAAVNNLPIGKGVGSCGNTAYTGQRTIVSDISRHPFWKTFVEMPKKAELAACWSEPILSSGQSVLGTFAIYYQTPREPDTFALHKMQELAQLASIAIERKNTEQQIRQLAFFDELTNLPNRRLLHEHLNRELKSVIRHHSFGALLFLDLDRFKMLNDSLGHSVGDELLRQIATRLQHCVRNEDTVARLGGDEFVILVPDCKMTEDEMINHILSLAERIQLQLQKPYSLMGYEHHITISIGITLFSRKNKIAEEILKQADTAMYNTKTTGHNTISFYHADMQKQADYRLELEKNLRIALAQQQFSLYFQPQYDNQYNFIGAEALLRWHHPQKGLILPSEFIPIAEETSLILKIGDWVLDAACQYLYKHPKLDHLSVNISVRQFHQQNFIKQIQATLKKYRVSPHRLMIEITESSVIESMDDSIYKLQTLQKSGVDFAIDDFGTGYSSLAYLKSLPLNQLKIDQSFIREIPKSNNAVIVETIIIMAQHLGLTVIAEGVETLEQVEFLQKHGCSGYQGYFFSKPLSEDDFDKLDMEKGKYSAPMLKKSG